MTRVLNFSAGPSQLPLTVVQKAAAQYWSMELPDSLLWR